LTTVSNREKCRLIDAPVITLDDYFVSEVAVIRALKVDVESHVFNVLTGAQKLMAGHKPLIVCGCMLRHKSEGVVLYPINFIQSLNYRGFLVTSKGCIPTTELKPNKHQKQNRERYCDTPATLTISFSTPLVKRKHRPFDDSSHKL
jgi:hypothetical protein